MAHAAPAAPMARATSETATTMSPDEIRPHPTLLAMESVTEMSARAVTKSLDERSMLAKTAGLTVEMCWACWGEYCRCILMGATTRSTDA